MCLDNSLAWLGLGDSSYRLRVFVWMWGAEGEGGTQSVPSPKDTARLEHLALLAILDLIICMPLGFPAVLSEEVSYHGHPGINPNLKNGHKKKSFPLKKSQSIPGLATLHRKMSAACVHSCLRVTHIVDSRGLPGQVFVGISFQKCLGILVLYQISKFWLRFPMSCLWQVNVTTGRNVESRVSWEKF